MGALNPRDGSRTDSLHVCAESGDIFLEAWLRQVPPVMNVDNTSPPMTGTYPPPTCRFVVWQLDKDALLADLVSYLFASAVHDPR